MNTNSDDGGPPFVPVPVIWLFFLSHILFLVFAIAIYPGNAMRATAEVAGVAITFGLLVALVIRFCLRGRISLVWTNDAASVERAEENLLNALGSLHTYGTAGTAARLAIRGALLLFVAPVYLLTALMLRLSELLIARAGSPDSLWARDSVAGRRLARGWTKFLNDYKRYWRATGPGIEKPG